MELGLGRGEAPYWGTDPGPFVTPVDVVGWAVLLGLCAGGASLAILLTAVLCSCWRNKRENASKKHNFGVKRSWDQRTFLNFRKPTPVTIPEKGSHYLKKSPSPTGTRCPPGGGEEELGLSPGEDPPKTRSLIATSQQSTNTEQLEPCETTLDETYEENEDGSKLGRLFFTVKYSFEKTALIVTINKCSNLPAKDSANKTSDPYVKLQLLPEKQHKVKTRVVRRTLHPVYDEDFTFYGVHFNQLQILTLHFVVLSFDRYSRDDVVGEVMVELDGIELSSTETCPLSLAREITPRSDKLKSQGRGELLVSLCHQPAASRVTVVVLKARNLPKMDITGLSDPYVKIYLLYNNQRISKKKTHVKKRTLNPVFNESFVFDLPRSEGGLAKVQLEFMLLDWDRVTKNEVIGRLELGGDNCDGPELAHWKEIQAAPRRQIAEWHKLKE
jgi:hypothetical protein